MYEKIQTKLILEKLSLIQREEREELFKKIQNILKVEKVNGTIVMGESLSNFTIPYPVHGYFLSEGRPKRRFYFAEDLEMSAKNPLNQRFPIIFDHEIGKAKSIVGAVTSIYYDSAKKALGWSGHINSELTGRNIKDKVINSVSATIFGEEFMDLLHGLACRSLRFKELSLVDAVQPDISGGADKVNSIVGA
jgi:hypothetical protein